MKLILFEPLYMSQPSSITLDMCRQLDAEDSLAKLRDKFAFSSKGNIHFDANSIGAMPIDVPDRIQRLMTECWRDQSRRSWTTEDWAEKPRILGGDISHMIGAGANDVVVCDNTTINLFKLLSYAWKIRNSGTVILTEAHNFPTDMHVLQGFMQLLKALKVDGQIRIAEDRAQILDMLDNDVAVLYLTHVDYRSSERWDMADINKKAKSVDALTLWDLSQSAGVLDVDLGGTGADFAVGCGYKYMCGGPGGPAFLYLNPSHQKTAWPTIAGWMGHAKWNKFLSDFEPAGGASSHLTGTPSVIANEVFAASAEIWRGVTRKAVATKHKSLTDMTIKLIEQECGPLGAAVISPKNYDERGGHVAFRHDGAGPVSEALVDNGLILSFRYPDSIRLGLGPLYHNHEDVWNAVKIIKDVLTTEKWRDQKYEKVAI
jgi:kynureninase